MVDAANGMIYLHNEGVIHRDLAARNLLVRFAEGKYTVKLSDFGMSKNIEGENYYANNSTMIPSIMFYAF